ncbi:MAG TPA: pyruvate kinase [Saprospiraceae bacterium]|nr:pyruvate kinase [Saprospiraceae bacterium]
MSPEIARLRSDLERIYENQVAAEEKFRNETRVLPRAQQLSFRNLLHYLALRREDLRPLQDALHDAGLSSLASAESHCMRQVQAVLQRMGYSFPEGSLSELDAHAGVQIIRKRAAVLFGEKAEQQIPHLMVTFETALADDYSSVKQLVKAGMHIARINTAHDNPEIWAKMVQHVRKAAKSLDRPCKVYVDLAGPKIRTSIMGKGWKKERVKLRERERFFLAEATATVDRREKVVGCTLPGVIKDLRQGDRVLFDDGLFEAVVETPGELMAELYMHRVSAPKARLKAEKGINFPDTQLSVRCLTEYDRSVIPFAVAHADILGFSFVRTAADVAELQQLLREFGTPPLPIVLKIETAEAVQNLPSLLHQGMYEQEFGVMIARGDLAVEIGFERLSEIQEEILWLCEAAHVPVIWATQVLETLNKSGIATRSEVTDAARAAHADCVMLNKGQYLLTVLATLQDILQRSGGHHTKKRYIFRPLRIAERFLG